MPEVNVKVKNVEDLKLTTKNVKEKDMPDRKMMKVSFLADIPPHEAARIMQFDRSGQQINIVLSSPQAMFDLKLEKVNLTSGEVSDH